MTQLKYTSPAPFKVTGTVEVYFDVTEAAMAEYFRQREELQADLRALAQSMGAELSGLKQLKPPHKLTRLQSLLQKF